MHSAVRCFSRTKIAGIPRPLAVPREGQNEYCNVGMGIHFERKATALEVVVVQGCFVEFLTGTVRDQNWAEQKFAGMNKRSANGLLRTEAIDCPGDKCDSPRVQQQQDKKERGQPP
ncbi:hypothetical protein [Desulfovibrio sp. TomC]|uniref:hypothetical protein n=1 Tax=Desulfovibrio sp. TomC TaxID=1562888 RepID=UPI0012E0FDFC|nr:hypothetical protein [Desulfovibrio sp. TomC]